MPAPAARAAHGLVKTPIKSLRNRCIAIPEAVENARYRYILTVKRTELVWAWSGGFFRIYYPKTEALVRLKDVKEWPRSLLGDEAFVLWSRPRDPWFTTSIARPKRASQAAKHMQFRFITSNGSGSVQTGLDPVAAAPGGAHWS